MHFPFDRAGQWPYQGFNSNGLVAHQIRENQMSNIQIIVEANSAATAEGEYSVGVKLYGLEYACRHINHELRVDCVSGQRTIKGRPMWQLRKNMAAVEAWFAAQIATLGAEYHEAHASLYREAA